MSKRRKSRRILKFEGLSAIPEYELCQWMARGPEIGGELWPSWGDWRAVYELCRGELLSKIRTRRETQMLSPIIARQLGGRPPVVPACERLYQAILAGEDPDQVKAQIRREVELNDPRKLLGSDDCDGIENRPAGADK